MNESDALNRLDQQVVRALQLQPRAAFSEIAEVLGVAEQTVARRYRRLRRDGLMRVIASVDPRALGVTEWTVRARCRPDAALPLANALARRDDVAWVAIHSGGWEVAFNLRARSHADTDELLSRLLPRTAPVLDVTAAAVLHVFVGGSATDWQGWDGVLTRAQTRRLTRPRRPGPAREVRLDSTDRPLLDLLARDGRAGYAALARATGQTVGRVGRRLDALLDAGVLYFDIDFAPALIGRAVSSTLWLTATPDQLHQVGEALAARPEVPSAAAVTGPANLIAVVVTSTLEDAYRFVTTELAAIAGITGYELSPQLRRIKQAGALLAGDRLAEPAPAPRTRRRAGP